MYRTYVRKFLVKKLPDFRITKEIKNERYYLYSENDTVIRVQSEEDVYEIERKRNESPLVRESSKIQIKKAEFEKLTTFAKNKIERKTVVYLDYPHLKMRIYEGNYRGLIRAEVNFVSEEEAKAFSPYPWFDKEITTTTLANDLTLFSLSREEFANLLK